MAKNQEIRIEPPEALDVRIYNAIYDPIEDLALGDASVDATVERISELAAREVEVELAGRVWDLSSEAGREELADRLREILLAFLDDAKREYVERDREIPESLAFWSKVLVAECEASQSRQEAGS